MGYHTEFEGSVEVSPPLSPEEVAFINAFCGTRRMKREKGPYFVGGLGCFGQMHEADVIDYNTPPDGQPSVWCQWKASPDGSRIEWDEETKFYEAPKWMAYLIEHFLGPAPIAKAELPFLSGGHVLDGVITAQGEIPDDRWELVVERGVVSVRDIP